MSNTRKKRDEFLPYPWKKYGFVRDKEIEIITERIYNNKKLELVHLRNTKEKPFRPEIIKQYTPEGVIWKRLDHPMAHMAITSEGILWDTAKGVPLKPTVTTFSITYNLGGSPIKFDELFKEAKWEWKMDEVLAKYQEYKYPVKDYRKEYQVKRTKPKTRKTRFPRVGLYKDMTE